MKRYISIITLLSVFSSVFGQDDLTFYHLGGATPQAQSFNASFFPESRMYLSLPVLSGVSIDINSDLSYNDVFVRNSDSDSVRLDFDNLLSNLKSGDRLKVDGTISIFQVGHRVGDFGAISAFVNDRYHASAYYPSTLMRYFIEGNGQFLDQEVREDYLGASAIYFREIGVGYAHQFKVLGTNLRFGARFKYLQGLFQSQTNPNSGLSMRTSADGYDLNLTFNQPEFYTAGTSMTSGDSINYFFQNENSGYGLDLGLDFDLNEKLSFALALNDIGKITWKQDVRNYRLINEEISIPEPDLSNLDDLSASLTDTLESLFEQEEFSEAYSTKLMNRGLASVRYRVLKSGTISASVYHETGVRQNLTKYGAGYTHRFGRTLILSSTVSYEENEGVDVGAGFILKFGTFQLYSSVDSFGNLFESTSVADVNKVNLRFGLNFLFGKKMKKEKEMLSPFPEEYDLDHLHEIE